MSMSFDQIENAIDVGSPVFLYEAIYDNSPGAVYRYTPTPLQTAANGKIWQPVQIKHSSIVSNGTLDNQVLKVTVRKNVALTQLFRESPPGIVVKLNIYRGYVGEGAYILEWTGRIMSMSIRPGEGEADFNCEPISTSLRNIGLRRKYQLGCPHVLYGTACKAAMLAHTEVGSIVGVVSANTIDVTLTGAQMGLTPANLIGGFIKITKANALVDRRAIIKVNSLGGRTYRVFMMSFMGGLETGLNVSLSKGCDHTFAMCRNTFNNVANFGGCPNIPVSNPFTQNTF